MESDPFFYFGKVQKMKGARVETWTCLRHVASLLTFAETHFLGLDLVDEQTPHFDHEHFCFVVEDLKGKKSVERIFSMAKKKKALVVPTCGHTHFAPGVIIYTQFFPKCRQRRLDNGEHFSKKA